MVGWVSGCLRMHVSQPCLLSRQGGMRWLGERGDVSLEAEYVQDVDEGLACLLNVYRGELI